MTDDETLHDRLVRLIAATRFPFPDQTDWPADYVTLAAPDGGHAIEGPDGPHVPDVVVRDGTGAVREVGEVELTLDPARLQVWRAGSLAADDHTDSGARHFFVYVPYGSEAAARDLLEGAGISYAGVRGWRATGDGGLEIVPFTTPGESKDHRVTRSGP
jgi:hypothetical protein